MRNCAWESANFERSGSIRVRRKVIPIIDDGSTILRGLAELRFIDQRYQRGLKSTLSRRAFAAPFCQRLSRDFGYQALSRFFPASEKSWEGPGDEASTMPGVVTLATISVNEARPEMTLLVSQCLTVATVL